MLKKIFNRVKRLLKPSTPKLKTSKPIIDPSIIQDFDAMPDNPYLISFPRTGSHWLRMLMELYFEQPTLVRTFYHFKSNDYLLLHTHDLELDVQRKNVIYLYRDPLSTIYSQLQYHQENLNDIDRILYWTDLYGKHLNKWLVTETFTSKKTVVRYEDMQNNLAGEFAKVVRHFDQEFDVKKFENISSIVTKEEVKRKTLHDQQVVQLASPYHETRDVFVTKHKDMIWQELMKDRERLRDFFTDFKSC